MKAGIVTLTGSENYGNVLQNYAMQAILADIGVQAETIRNTTRYGHYLQRKKNRSKFTPQYIYRYLRNQLNYRYNIKNSGSSILRTINYCRKNEPLVSQMKQDRQKAFMAFTEKHITWSPETLDINHPWTKQQVDAYDFYVAGSDQVWNPTYPATSSINFLQFAPADKRVACAPSFGIGVIPADLQEEYRSWLSEIPFLSVREEQGRQIIRQLTGRDVPVLCDPTMAVKVSEWEKLEAKPASFTEEPYVLTYFLGDRTSEYDRKIQAIARENHLRCIHLFDVLDPDHYAVSPEEFLYLIHHARLVCTDSFHGTVFSILFKRDFIAFTRVEDGNSMESRVSTLLKTYHLEQRHWQKVTAENLFQTDYSGADTVTAGQRQQFLSFLTAAVQSMQPDNEVSVGCDSVYGERKADCSGCGSCALVCPRHCIRLVPDAEGFIYPRIDPEQCIRCNRCRDVCPIAGNDSLPVKKQPLAAYVGYSGDEAIRRTSSSGGLFYHIAECVLEKQGVIFGAGYDEQLRVIHKSAESPEELSQLQGSKYVQSDTGNTYTQAKRYLDAGRWVLYTGTPCQIHGLKAYLREDYSKLITQDIVCHGVPSPAVWQKYIGLPRFKGAKRISFRNKRYGWHYFSLEISGNKRVYRKRLDEDVFLRLFLDNTVLRPICYDCPFKQADSPADITLADCWKPSSVVPGIKDTDQGLSLVFAQSEKGLRLLEEIGASGEVRLNQADMKKALSSQEAIFSSVRPNPRRAQFFSGMEKTDAQSLFGTWYRSGVISGLKKKSIYCKTKLKNFLVRRNIL